MGTFIGYNFFGPENSMTSLRIHNRRNASDFNQALSQWKVSNVTDMSYMFSDASHFNQDLSQWNVSSVRHMSGMFSGASHFNRECIQNWDLSKVDNTFRMFG